MYLLNLSILTVAKVIFTKYYLITFISTNSILLAENITYYSYSNANLKTKLNTREQGFLCNPIYVVCLHQSYPGKSLQASCTSDIQQPYETFANNKIWSHSLKGILTEYITENKTDFSKYYQCQVRN